MLCCCEAESDNSDFEGECDLLVAVSTLSRSNWIACGVAAQAAPKKAAISARRSMAPCTAVKWGDRMQMSISKQRT